MGINFKMVVTRIGHSVFVYGIASVILVFLSSQTQHLAASSRATDSQSKTADGTEYFQSLIKEQYESSHASFIVQDLSIQIYDVLKTDSGDIGYVRYLFHAMILTTPEFKNHTLVDKIESLKISYTLVVEGSEIPTLSRHPFFINVCRPKTQDPTKTMIWSVSDKGIKIALSSDALLNSTKEILSLPKKSIDKGHACSY